MKKESDDKKFPMASSKDQTLNIFILNFQKNNILDNKIRRGSRLNYNVLIKQFHFRRYLFFDNLQLN